MDIQNVSISRNEAWNETIKHIDINFEAEAEKRDDKFEEKQKARYDKAFKGLNAISYEELVDKYAVVDTRSDETKCPIGSIFLRFRTFKNASGEYYLKCDKDDFERAIGLVREARVFENFEKTIPDQTGGFELVNMNKVSRFDQVNIVGMLGKEGGCLSVRLDQDFRHQGYNNEHYKFTNLELTNCISTDKGAGIFIENIRKMSLLSGNIKGSNAAKSGGGIFYNCLDEYDNCELLVESAFRVNSNNAGIEGGGIKWLKQPIIRDYRSFLQNSATYYGPNQASFAIELGRLKNVLDPSL